MNRLPSNKRSFILRRLFFVLLIILGASAVCNALELRKVDDGTMSQSGFEIPDEAVRVFVYAGEPGGIKVNEKTIAVDYGRCGILFDRKKGEIIERFDVLDGWPETRPETFPKNELSRINSYLIGPGIVRSWRLNLSDKKDEPEIACSAEFQGSQWIAFQPAYFISTIQEEGYANRTGPYSTWSGVLERLNKESYIKANAAGQESKRYTMSDGLASNIVTRLAVSQGFLWANCVDVYEPEKESWGPGGLSRFDPKTNNWEHVKTIEGHPVRWITLMETIGDELWIGFREGEGVEGDKIYYGMGVSAEIYRPKTSAILLARFSKGKWTVFSKALSFDEEIGDSQDSPTQMPLRFAISNGKAILFCGYSSRERSYNYDYKLDGYVCLFDLKSGQWKTFDLYKDFDADRLVEMYCEKNEILIKSNLGVHRWDAESQSWKFLEPKTELKNPSLSTAVLRKNELWVGYTNQSFGVLGQQGISVFNEETMKWSYISPEQIGTGCPVRRMAVLSNGDLWVLFRERPNRAAAEEYSYYQREAGLSKEAALGCFRNEKWEYPLQLPGIDDSPASLTLYSLINGNIYDLAVLDDKLFISNRSGVYLGRYEWEKIVEGEVLRMEPSYDGNSLIILHQGPRKDEDSSTFQRGLYDIDTGEVSFESLPYEKIREIELEPPDFLWEQQTIELQQSERWHQYWRLCDNTRIISSLGSGVIETPYAFWLVKEGELVRLDRKSIEKIIEKRN